MDNPQTQKHIGLTRHRTQDTERRQTKQKRGATETPPKTQHRKQKRGATETPPKNLG